MRPLSKSYGGSGVQGSTSPGTLIDGISGLNWTPRTLFLFVNKHEFSSFSPQRLPPQVSPTGALGAVVQLTASLGGGGRYARRFTVPILDPIQVDVSGWWDVRVELLAFSKGLTDAELRAVVSERARATLHTPPVFLAEAYPLQDTYPVPPGADRAYYNTADANQFWVTGGIDPGSIAIPDPVAVGDVREVAGTHLATGGPNKEIVWRVIL